MEDKCFVQTNDNAQSSAGVQQCCSPATPIFEMQQPTVTTLAQLQTYAKGKIVKLPDFADGQPFVARLIRPSMLVLAKQGRIPNNLMTTATALFNGDQRKLDSDNENLMKDMYDVCHIICEASLVEPTLADIESVGLTLSDDQVMAIFNYAQVGVKALESFR